MLFFGFASLFSSIHAKKEKSTKIQREKNLQTQKQHNLMTLVCDIIKHQISNVFKTVHLDHELAFPISVRTTCVTKQGLRPTFPACCSRPTVGGKISDLNHLIGPRVGTAQVLVVSSHDDLILWMKRDYSVQRA